MFFQNKTHPAFTIIEMLITISIIAITATFAVMNLNFQRDDLLVEQAAREFYSGLQYARNLAISGKVFKDETGDGVPDVPNGNGVYFALVASFPDYFYFHVLYADLYGGATSKQYDQGTEAFGESHRLNTSDILISLYFDGNTGIPFGLPQTIFFATPNGDITYYDYNTEVSTVTEIGIEFASAKDPSVKKRVVINRVTGQIYINENP